MPFLREGTRTSRTFQRKVFDRTEINPDCWTFDSCKTLTIQTYGNYNTSLRDGHNFDYDFIIQLCGTNAASAGRAGCPLPFLSLIHI